MAGRLNHVARGGSLIVKAALTAALAVWVAGAPLVWVLRDGLGPDMVESAGLQAAFKFLAGWGAPALALAVPLAGLTLVERALIRGAASGTQEEAGTGPL